MAGRVTVEDSFTLDIGRLIRDEGIRHGQSSHGMLTVTRVANTADFLIIGYEASLVAPDHARISLDYQVNDEWQHCRVTLESTRPNYGGLRWWFRCPETGRRAAKLHLPPGRQNFASRKAHGLSHRSQHDRSYDRALDRAEDIRMKLGGGPSPLEPFPARPQGMPWRTYWRLKAEAHAAECRYWRGAAERFGVVIKAGRNFMAIRA